MDTSAVKQELVFTIDRVIRWRRGMLETEPADEDNARCLELLTAIREDVAAMRESDRAFVRLAEIHAAAETNGAEDQLERAALFSLRRYGVITEPALDPYTFVQDFILDLVVALELSRSPGAGGGKSSSAEAHRSYSAGQ